MGKLLTLQQVADRLAVSKRTVRGLISSGKLPAVAINQRIIRVNEADLASVLEPVTPHVKDRIDERDLASVLTPVSPHVKD